jgi:hypothetical protein
MEERCQEDLRKVMSVQIFVDALRQVLAQRVQHERLVKLTRVSQVTRMVERTPQHAQRRRLTTLRRILNQTSPFLIHLRQLGQLGQCEKLCHGVAHLLRQKIKKIHDDNHVKKKVQAAFIIAFKINYQIQTPKGGYKDCTRTGKSIKRKKNEH